MAQRRLAPEGIRRDYHGILLTLAEFGPIAQAELGDRLRIGASGIVSLLDDLQSKGYVSREKDWRNRRRNVIALTELGVDALHAGQRAIEACEQHIFKSLPCEDSQRLTDLLGRLVDSIEPFGAGAD